MDSVEKNIKNTGKLVKYSKLIDLRQVTDSLQVKVYATGSQYGKKFNKTLFITMDYDVSIPVQLYIIYKGKNLVEGFLYFKSEDFKMGENKLNKKDFSSDFILRLHRETNRTLSLKQVGTKRDKSLLSTQEIFLPGQTAALQVFSPPKNGKSHQIEMLLPGIGIDPTTNEKSETIKNLLSLGFDVDIRAFSTTGPITSIFFKVGAPGTHVGLVRKYFKNKTGDIDKVTLVEPRRIKTLTKAPTSYLEMKTKDLELGQVKFNYFDYFQSLNQEYTDYYLKSSEVFIVKNIENYKFTLGDFLKDSEKELPYNISRKLENNEIVTSSPYFDRGVRKFPLSWVDEFRDNKFFTDLNRCVDFSFYSSEHLNSFEQSLKEIQIANLETYSSEYGSTKPRTYNSINQWVNRTNHDYFNDLTITNYPGGGLKNLTVCPSKRTKVTEYAKNNIQYKGTECACKYSNDSSEKLQTIISKPNVNEPCSETCRKTQLEFGYQKCWTCEMDYYSPIYDLRNDFFATTYSTIKESFSAATKYSEYTSGSITGSNTYDIYISGNGFTAVTSPTTGIVIPLNNINRIEHRPFIGVSSPVWVPFNSWQSLSSQTGTTKSLPGSGPVIIQSGDPTNYTIYKSLSGGTYKFQYNAYLDFKYKDTKWCEYLTTNYLSGTTSSISYPSTEYEIKRLINSSILEYGTTEGETVKQDTGGVYFPGKNGLNNDTGLLNFNFNIFLEKQTTSGIISNVVSTTVGASSVTNTSANQYLIEKTNIVQNTFSGFSNCYSSGTSANTIYHTRVPITLDTGLISLSSGETIMLKYNVTFNAVSKVSGGDATVELNLGHKIDLSGSSVASPFYRITKYSPTTGNTSNLQKSLFVNPQKISKPQKFIDEGGVETEQTTKGTLYVINNGYNPISAPVVTQETFKSLTFIDNGLESKTLDLDMTINKPSNNWARQIQDNQLTDYYIPNQKDLVEIKSGVVVFNLPRYDQRNSVTCNYKFPQISHSYIIKNVVSNVRGVDKEHYIVVTPKDKIYVPCFTPTLQEKYELIESQIKITEQIDNVDNQLIIDGQPIIIKTSRSEPLTQIKADEGFKCSFYCVCQDTKLTKGLHPFYGTTDVITDTAIFDCDECEDKAEDYCGGLGKTCKPKVFTEGCIGDKSNLYTSGDEYLLPNGDEYVGFYHIHDSTPMVGAVHKSESHDELIPVMKEDFYTTNKLNYTTPTTTNSGGGGGY
tara:strand:- start:13403 stop:17050 length:3648 start_codon:yes stop_codon:yes gene_type:complete